MPLAIARTAFSHPDRIFELKDGFRSLAYIDDGRCSRKAQRLPQVVGPLPPSIRAR
jgi:hypothetical protein